MKYKGYSATIELDEVANVLCGRVDGIQDVVTFEAESLAQLKKEFEASVDDYLEYCASRAEEPQKPYSGRFVVRLNPATHKRAAEAARAEGLSLNAFISKAIERQIEGGGEAKIPASRSRRRIGAKSSR